MSVVCYIFVKKQTHMFGLLHKTVVNYDYCNVLNGHWRVFVFIVSSFYFFLITRARLSLTTLSFLVHVKLF